MTFTQTNKSLWLLTGGTLSLSAVSFLRLDWGLYHPCVPTTLLLVIGLLNVVHSLSGRSPWPSLSTRRLWPLFLLTVAFFSLHAVQLARTQDMHQGMKDLASLGTSLGIFWTALLFFPREDRFAKQFLSLVLVGTAILLSVLIYKYAFVFHRTYLGTELAAYNRGGKNRLGWFLTLTFPPMTALIVHSHLRKKLLWWILVTLVVMGIIYTQSRSAWAAYLAICLSLMTAGFRHGKHFGGKMLCLLVLTTTVAYGCVTQLTNNMQNDLKTRLVSLLAPATLSENQEDMILGKYSYRDRLEQFQFAWRQISAAPLLGAGLSNTAEELHNDYVTIGCELGIVGVMLYFSLLVTIAVRLFSRQVDRRNWQVATCRATFLGMLLLSCFIDIYRTNMYWFFLGLVIVLSSTRSHLVALSRRSIAQHPVDVYDVQRSNDERKTA